MAVTEPYVLYAIEQGDAETDDQGNYVKSLMPRYDENGEGSPLIFTDKKVAEDILKEMVRENGSADAQVIQLVMAQRFEEPYRCDDCTEKKFRELYLRGEDLPMEMYEVWGSYAEHQPHNQ